MSAKSSSRSNAPRRASQPHPVRTSSYDAGSSAQELHEDLLDHALRSPDRAVRSADVLTLQRVAGNAAVQRLLAARSAAMSIQRMSQDGTMTKADKHDGLLANVNQHRPTGTLQLTYHHIVDKDKLMHFWNSVRGYKIKNGKTRSMLQKLVGQVIDKAVEAAPDTLGYEVDGQPATKESITKAGATSFRAEKSVNTNYGEIFERMFQWIPGNIMEGPKSDLRWKADQLSGTDWDPALGDPGNEFETGAQYVIPQGAYIQLAQLNKTITQFMKEPSDELLVKAIGYLQFAVEQGSVYAFDQSKWRQATILGQTKWVIRQ